MLELWYTYPSPYALLELLVHHTALYDHSPATSSLLHTIHDIQSDLPRHYIPSITTMCTQTWKRWLCPGFRPVPNPNFVPGSNQPRELPIPCRNTSPDITRTDGGGREYPIGPIVVCASYRAHGRCELGHQYSSLRPKLVWAMQKRSTLCESCQQLRDPLM